MFLLALHIGAIAILIMITWGVAYRAGERRGIRHTRRELGVEEESLPKP